MAGLDHGALNKDKAKEIFEGMVARQDFSNGSLEVIGGNHGVAARKFLAKTYRHRVDYLTQNSVVYLQLSDPECLAVSHLNTFTMYIV